MTLADFEADQKTYDAVERRLERLSEAAFKLGEQAAVLVQVSLGRKFARW